MGIKTSTFQVYKANDYNYRFGRCTNMEIHTERCTIRWFEENEIDDFMKYRNDDGWMRYQGFKGLTKQAYSKELLGEHSFTKGVQLAIINNVTNCLIGDIYLKQENNTFWIGYTINPLKARRGYAYEVLVAVINWVKQKGYVGVNAGVLPENIASINLLKKLGFTYISTDDNGEQIYTLHIHADQE